MLRPLWMAGTAAGLGVQEAGFPWGFSAAKMFLGLICGASRRTQVCVTSSHDISQERGSVEVSRFPRLWAGSAWPGGENMK